jgi:hypothetical protein
MPCDRAGRAGSSPSIRISHLPALRALFILFLPFSGNAGASCDKVLTVARTLFLLFAALFALAADDRTVQVDKMLASSTKPPSDSPISIRTNPSPPPPPSTSPP